MKKLFTISVLLLAAASLTAQAEDPVALIGEGATATGLPEGMVVESINNPSVNHSGGWAFNVNVGDGVTTLGTIWGNGTGGPGGVMRTEGIFPPYEQTSYESFWGMGAGGVACYSAMSTDQDSGVTGLDGVWLDDIPIAVEEMVFPYLADHWWSFGSRPGTTEDGVPYFVGGATPTQGGSTAVRGLFYGPDAAPVILGGDVLPGLPAPVTVNSGISFDYRFSPFGTHYIAEVTMDTGDTGTNTALVFDGEGLMIDGQLVQEGMPVPEAAGGFPGENWSGLDYCGVTESGSYMFTGDTSGDTATDEFVLIDGVIIIREGKEFGDLTVSGSIEGAFLNNDGDFVVIWDVDLPTGENVEAMIFNGEVVLKEGDIIDTDGDGVPEPDAVIDSFTGISSVVLSDRDENQGVTVFFTADVSVPDVGAGDPDGMVILAGDEIGLDEDIVIEGNTRAVVEFGYGLTFGGVVSTMLGEMDCQVRNDGVQISWRMSGTEDADRLSLRATSGQQSRDVPFLVDGGGLFTALDRSAVAGEITYRVLITGADGQARVLGEKAVRLETPAAGIVMNGAHPNPFNPETRITFKVAADQQVRLAIYDLGGNLVTVLADEVFTAGVHQIPWNGRDQNGAAVPSGTYFARALGRAGVQTAKLMLVK